jgi:hypothetical protein
VTDLTVTDLTGRIPNKLAAWQASQEVARHVPLLHVVTGGYLRKEGNGCVVDVHVTLFDFSATGEMKTTRLDVDGLAIGGIGVSCQ